MKLKAYQYLKPLKYFIEKTGGSFTQVALLVDMKLLLDNRKPQLNASGKAKDPRNTLIRQSIMFLVVGLFMGLMMINTPNPFTYCMVSHTYLMVMLTISMLSEYSVSLFDTRDNHLIIPLPLTGQTMGWARVIHIMMYLLLFFISISLPMFIIAGVKFGGTTMVLFFISGLLNTLFTLFYTIFLYMALLKLTSGEKLKDVLMYIQIGFSLLIMIGYQFLSRSIFSSGNYEPSFSDNWIFLLIPPAWFAYLPEIPHMVNKFTIIGSTLAVFVPIVSIYFIAKKLFVGFEDKLALMSATSATIQKDEKNSLTTGLWYRIVRTIMAVKSSEQAIFKFMWKLSGRERMFKQTLLPMLGYSMMLPIIMLFTNKGIGQMGEQYQIFMYFSIMTSSMIPAALTIGSNPHTGWIFQSMPNLNAGMLISVTLKAAFGKFFAPVFLVMALPLFYFKGFLAIPGLITLFVFNYAISLLIIYLQTPHFPFSQSKSGAQGGKSALRMFGVILLAMPFGLLHFFLASKNEWLVLAPLIILIPLVLYIELVRMRKKFSWKLMEYINQQNS